MNTKEPMPETPIIKRWRELQKKNLDLQAEFNKNGGLGLAKGTSPAPEEDFRKLSDNWQEQYSKQI